MRLREFQNSYSPNLLEAKPEAPLEVPTPAQRTVADAVIAAQQIQQKIDELEKLREKIKQKQDVLKRELAASKFAPAQDITNVRPDPRNPMNWIGKTPTGASIAGGPISK